MSHGSVWSIPLKKCLVLDELFSKVVEEELFPYCFSLDDGSSSQLQAPRICIPGKGLAILNETSLHGELLDSNPLAVAQALFYLSYSAPAGASLCLVLLNALCDRLEVVKSAREALTLVLIPLLKYMNLPGLTRAMPLIQSCLSSPKVLQAVLLEIIPCSSYAYNAALLKLLPPVPPADPSPLLTSVLWKLLPVAHLLYMGSDPMIVQRAHSILTEHKLTPAIRSLNGLASLSSAGQFNAVPLPTSLIRYISYLLSAPPPESEIYGVIDPRIEDYLLTNDQISPPPYILLRQLAGYSPKDIDWLLARRMHLSTELYSLSLAQFVLALNDPVNQYDEELAFEMANSKAGYRSYASSVVKPPFLAYRPTLCMAYDERREFLFIYATSIGGAAFRFPIQKLMKNKSEIPSPDDVSRYPDSFKETVISTSALVTHIRSTIAMSVIPDKKFPDGVTRGNAGGLVEMVISTINKGVISKLVIPELHHLHNAEQIGFKGWAATDRLLKFIIRWLNESPANVRHLEARLWLAALFAVAVPANSLAFSKVSDLIFLLALHTLRSSPTDLKNNWKSLPGAILKAFQPLSAPARVADILIRRVLEPVFVYNPPNEEKHLEGESAPGVEQRLPERRKMLRLSVHTDIKSKSIPHDELARALVQQVRNLMEQQAVIKALLGSCTSKPNSAGYCPCTLARTPNQWDEIQAFLWQHYTSVSDLNVIWLAHNQTHLYSLVEMYTLALVPKLVDWQIRPCLSNAVIITFWVRYVKYLHGRHERAAPPRICLELDCKEYAWIIGHMINAVWTNEHCKWTGFESDNSDMETADNTLFSLLFKAGAPLVACLNPNDSLWSMTEFKYRECAESINKCSSLICVCRIMLPRKFPIPTNELESCLMLLFLSQLTRRPYCSAAVRRYISANDQAGLFSVAMDDQSPTAEYVKLWNLIGYSAEISDINPQTAIKVFSPWTSWS